MNRSTRLAMAQETLAVIAEGRYTAPSGAAVSIGPALTEAVRSSVLYRPEDFPVTIPPSPSRDLDPAHPRFDTKSEVTAETTLEAARRLARECAPPDPLALNFASAKNPGGGFLSGSQAQEESLARSSGLYASLLENMEMYEHNRKLGTALYSDHMIYSPNVPVFRDDDGTLLEEPYNVSFLTVPAVNAGAVASNEPHNMKRVREVMAARLAKLLWVASEQGHRVLVLGAWGCGVFANDPAMVAGLFAEALGESGPFFGAFERVVYAVYDRSPNGDVLNAFRNAL